MKAVLESKPRREYWSVQKAIRGAGFNIQTKMLRKLNSTILKNELDREVIDLLQGRVGESIFVKFYYRPALAQIREKTLRALKPLETELLNVEPIETATHLGC
jgi:intergrase/recombinase